jgi:hypothetical protein
MYDEIKIIKGWKMEILEGGMIENLMEKAKKYM